MVRTLRCQYYNECLCLLSPKPSVNLQGSLLKWQVITKKRFPLLPLRLSHKDKIRGIHIFSLKSRLKSNCNIIQSYIWGYFFFRYTLSKIVPAFINRTTSIRFTGRYSRIRFPNTATHEMLAIKTILYRSSHIFLYCSTPSPNNAYASK